LHLYYNLLYGIVGGELKKKESVTESVCAFISDSGEIRAGIYAGKRKRPPCLSKAVHRFIKSIITETAIYPVATTKNFLIVQK